MKKERKKKKGGNRHYVGHNQDQAPKISPLLPSNSTPPWHSSLPSPARSSRPHGRRRGGRCAVPLPTAGRSSSTRAAITHQRHRCPAHVRPLCSAALARPLLRLCQPSLPCLSPSQPTGVSQTSPASHHNHHSLSLFITIPHLGGKVSKS